jgi:hypothetical protein
MGARTKSMLLGCGLSIAALCSLTVIPKAISQESERRATPLKDVCPEGWSRYDCRGSFRLCIAPGVETQYDLTKSQVQYCRPDNTFIVPDAWAHVSPEIQGYLSRDYNDRYFGYRFYRGVKNLNLSMIERAEKRLAETALQTAVDDLELGSTGYEYDTGIAEYEDYAMKNKSFPPELPLDSNNIESGPPKTSVTDVCPAQWSRFSCQFVRLCVSPRVSSKYDLASSDEFKYAHCKADKRSVPEGDTHFSPYDVGYATLLVNRVYFKAVRLDSSDIFEGDIEEAIERLVLVPIPPSGLMEYDQGYLKGRARFERSVSKANQKDKQSEDAKTPH